MYPAELSILHQKLSRHCLAALGLVLDRWLFKPWFGEALMTCRIALLAGVFLVFTPRAFGCVISVESGMLPSSGKIAAISLDATHASIGSGPRSGGWRLTIDNDPSWRTRLKAIAVVGAAFIDADSLSGLVSLEPEPGVTCQFLDQHGNLRLRLQVYDNDAMRAFILRRPMVRVSD